MSRRLLALAAAAGAAPAAVVSQGGLISNFGCGGFAEFQARLDTVEVACCGDEDCPTGVPAACSVNCALVFSPFYEACGVLIGRMLDDDAAGTAQIAAFDQLDGQCRSSVDLSSALAIITALRDDDSDYLVPPLDGFETYRYTDPQQLASRGGQYATQMASCSTGWSGDPNVGGGGGFGQPGQQCHNAQGQYGIACPDGTGCSILGDLSDCPDSSTEVVTECTQAVAQRCTPRQCAAACANAQGCISFRYNKQSEVGPDGQVRNRLLSHEKRSVCQDRLGTQLTGFERKSILSLRSPQPTRAMTDAMDHAWEEHPIAPFLLRAQSTLRTRS
jgi:hypothetical protein